MRDLVDRSHPVRAGEELDLERLRAYLAEHLPDARGALEVEQFPSGYSNLTYLVRLGPTELVLRRPPFGNRVKTAHDMGREHRVLSHLSRVFPLAPRPLLYCDDEAVLGAPFYLMERRRGVVLDREVAAAVTLEPEAARRLSQSFIDHLAALHTLDYEAAGLGELGWPEGYAERQVKGWSQRYFRARTDDWPELEEVVRWLRARVPDDARAALIHNDYKYDNLVLDPDDLSRIVAVLDWEMATVGHPLMDLGTTLAYWVEAGESGPVAASGLLPPAFPGSLCRRELVARYLEKTGLEAGDVLFFYCFGLFKVAVIVQQIYYRWVRGHTRDRRFAELNRVVELLGKAAAAAADRGTL